MKTAFSAPVRRSRAGFVLFALICVAVQAAPPAWIQEALRADTTEWTSTNPLIILLDNTSVQYTAADKTRRKIRAVVRVASEAGRTQAHASLWYNPHTDKIRTAKAWIVSADGKNTESFNKPDFTDTVAMYSQHYWTAQRVITFAAADRIEVGGALAWEFDQDVESSIFDVSNHFASNVPVVHSMFEVAPFPGGKLAWYSSSTMVPPPQPGAAGALRWEMKRIQPLPPEMPVGYLPNPMRVSVRCTPAQGAPNRTWEHLAQLVAGIIEPRIVADAEVKALAAKLTKDVPQRWERVRKITEFVQKDLPYLALTLDKDSLAGYRPHLPADVLKRRLGDCKDKATLVAAMLRSLGDNAHVVLVHALNPKALAPDWPSAAFNHAIVGIPADAEVPAHWPTVDAGPAGKLVLFDATDPATPLGVLPPADQGGYGLVVTNNPPGLLRLPVSPATHDGVAREATATLNEKGDLNTKAHEAYVGSAAASTHYTRFNQSEDVYRRTIERRLASTLPSLAGFKWKDNWSQATSEYGLTLEFTAERYGRWVGREMMLVIPRVFPSQPPLRPWKSNHDGVVWFTPRHTRDVVRIILPEGFTIAEVPKPVTAETPLMRYSLQYRVEGQQFTYESTVTRQTGVLEKADYEALRSAYQRLEEAERRPIVLKRTAAKSAAAE